MKRKAIFLLVAGFVLLSFTACNNNDDNTESSVSRLTDDELKQEGVIGYSEFENQFKDVVNFSDYKLVSEGNYCLNNSKKITFDNKIKIKEISFDFNNITFNDLKDNGFDYAENTVLNVYPYSDSELIYMTNSEITSNTAFVARNSTENMVMAEECKISKFQFGEEGMYGSGVDKFNFTNGISDKSDWKDVIDEFGEPESVYYHIYDLGNGKAYDTLYINYTLSQKNQTQDSSSQEDYKLTLEYSPSLDCFEYICFDVINND